MYTTGKWFETKIFQAGQGPHTDSSQPFCNSDFSVTSATQLCFKHVNHAENPLRYGSWMIPTYHTIPLLDDHLALLFLVDQAGHFLNYFCHICDLSMNSNDIVTAGLWFKTMTFLRWRDHLGPWTESLFTWDDSVPLVCHNLISGQKMPLNPFSSP